MALHTLLYTSAAVREMTAKDLQEILDRAREFNGQHNITGILLYYPRSFMQVLEGEKDTIFELFDRIVLDDRHTAISLAFDEPISMRIFPDWGMDFVMLEKTDAVSITGFTRFFEEGFKDKGVEVKRSLAKQFLLSFKDDGNRLSRSV